jgi:hypothetical protein
MNSISRPNSFTIQKRVVTWLFVLASLCPVLRPAAAATAPDTFFISSDSTLNGQGAYWYQAFTVSATSSFVLRVACDYTADAAILPAGQLNNFIGGRAFNGYAIFGSTFGTHYVRLGAGSYYVAIRNRANAANQYDLELDKRQTAPADSQHYYRFNDLYLNHAGYVGANGGYLIQPFTIQAGFRYFMDGGNSGLDTYVIPANQVANFKANTTFQYYTDYSGVGDTAQPGYYELNLAPGTYYLCFRNHSSIKKAAVYTLERWRIYNQPGGIDLSGSSSWNTSGSYVNIAVDKVSNTNAGGSSGSLRLRLWATRSPYAGGSISGYVLGVHNLNPLPAGYYYSTVHGYVPFSRPPSGYYFTTITLEQYTATGWYISDYVTFSGTTHF